MILLEDFTITYTDSVGEMDTKFKEIEDMEDEALIEEVTYANMFFGIKVCLKEFEKEYETLGELSKKSRKKLEYTYVLIYTDIVYVDIFRENDEGEQENTCEFCEIKYA